MNTQHFLQPSSSADDHTSMDRYTFRKSGGYSSALTQGNILARRLSGNENQTYYLYIPRSRRSNSPIFVSVHGIKRRAEDHVRHFIPLAEQCGCIVVAPHFPEKRFKGYQRLGINCKGERADWILDSIISEVKTLTGSNPSKLHMFGYSGGAQFVSRYMMIYPHRVARIALAAAGWYTFPNPLADFPMGIKRAKGHRDINFDLMKILSVPTCVLVGENDIVRDDQLKKDKNIDQLQGVNRLERGKRWAKVMLAFAKANKLNTPYDFRVLPDSGHSFRECMQKGGMGLIVFEFLFGQNGGLYPQRYSQS